MRPLVERCVTIARRALVHQQAADELNTDAAAPQREVVGLAHAAPVEQWTQAIAPVVAARRQALRLLGDKQAVRILFADLASRFADRPGGYTRVLHLATPRLGDAAPRALLEFVGTRDRVQRRP